MHDDIEDILTRIITRVTESTLSDVGKADVLSSVSLGMHRLVWPILLAHVPEYLLANATSNDVMTLDDYQELLESSLQNHATAKEMHDELLGALTEVDVQVAKAVS